MFIRIVMGLRRVIVGVWATLALLALGSRVLGTAFGAPPAVFANLTHCASFCWHNIIPGTTSMTEADTMLIADGYIVTQSVNHFQFRTYNHPGDACQVTLTNWDGVVRTVELNDCGVLRLGDLIIALGEPDGVMWGAEFSFAGGIIGANGARANCDTVISAFVPMMTIRLKDAPAVDSNLTQWRGFINRRHYARLNGGVDMCR